MKENKRFFDKNYLNKGHIKKEDNLQSNLNKLVKKYQNSLPPIELMEHYEELHPGTMEKLLKITEKEQGNRHDLEMSKIAEQEKSLRLEKVLSFIFAILIISMSYYFANRGNDLFAFTLIILIIFFSRTIFKNNNRSTKYFNYKKKSPSSHKKS